jgi:hypothetical protein
MKKLPSLENYTFFSFFCLLPASIQGMVAPHFIVILSWMNDDHCDLFFLSLLSIFGLWLSWQLSTSYFSQIWLLKK